MIHVGIHQWLTLKWGFMAQGYTPIQIMHGYLNGLVSACYEDLKLTDEPNQD